MFSDSWAGKKTGSAKYRTTREKKLAKHEMYSKWKNWTLLNGRPVFSLKKKIEYWGDGRYQYEGDTFVQLSCMDCSKFNPKACEKCR